MIGAPKSDSSGHFFGGSVQAGQGFGKSEKPAPKLEPIPEKKYFFGGSTDAGNGYGKSYRLPQAKKKNHL